MRFLIVLMVLTLTACGSQPVKNSTYRPAINSHFTENQGVEGEFQFDPQSSSVNLHVAPITFSGHLSNKSGRPIQPNSAMLVGGSSAALAASFATLFTMNKGKVNAEEQARIDEANKVLEPYQASIDSISADSLNQKLLTVLTELDGVSFIPTGSAQADLQALLLPEFILSQDGQELHLKSALIIGTPESIENGSKPPVYQRSIRVVSTPDAEFERWLDPNSEDLLAKMVQLSGIAISVALKDWKEPHWQNASAATTARYRIGGEKRVERGRVLARYCHGLQLVETLRQEVLVLPMDESSEGCTPASHMSLAFNEAAYSDRPLVAQ
jgi:hypothetical protein